MAVKEKQWPNNLQLVYIEVQDECPKCKGKRGKTIDKRVILSRNMLVIRKKCSRCGHVYKAETAYGKRTI